jgi:tetratricopeptide (TPR) repeat protein
LVLVAYVWIAGCSGSPAPPPEEPDASPDLDALGRACEGSFPQLAPCQGFVVQGVREERTVEIRDRLARLGREHPDHWAVAYLSGYLRYVSGDDLDGATAVEAFEEARQLAERSGSGEGQAQALLMLGAVADFHDNDVDGALKLYLQAAGHAESGKDDRLYVQAAWAVATVYPELGLHTDQIDWLGRALDRLGEEGDPDTRRTILYSLGIAHWKLGDWSSSQRYLDELLESAIRDEDAKEEVYALQALGVLELDRDPPSAIPWFERCAARAGEAGIEGIRAHAEVLVGVALVQAGRLEEGRDVLAPILDRSLRFAEEDVELRVQGLANLHFLAESERRLGHADRALELYERTRARAEEWRNPYYGWQVSAGLAALHFGEERWELAAAEARRGVDQVESVRAALREEGQRLYFLRQRSSVYATLASALEHLHPGELDQSFALIEDVHARTLRESLQERSDDGTAAPPVLLGAAQSMLAEGDLLLEYLLGEEESLLLAATRDSARLHRLSGREELDDLVERYGRALRRPLTALDARLDPEADFRRTGAPGFELHRILLGPVSSEVAAADRLIIVPDKQLHRLPFEALPTTDPAVDGPLRFLAQSHAVVYLPAAAFLADRGRRGGEKVVVVAAGGAVPSLGLAELTQLPLEVEGVRGSYPEDRLRLLRAEDATPEALAGALAGDVGVLHVIGHALLDPVSGPEIVLAGDALLAAGQIIAMAPTPPLVVLSACETAEGELVGGEGILGLVRAFRLAGSSRTVASLWQAEDESAARMMVGFHAGMRAGLSPSRALAKARREQLSGSFAHPFGWAAFVLYGAD